MRWILLKKTIPQSLGLKQKKSVKINKKYRGSATNLRQKKTFDTQDSRVVPHRSTDWAQPCLTSQFGWDTVYPQWYDRMMRCMIFSSMLLCTDQRTVMKPMLQLSHHEQVRVGVVGNISACHADAPGSIPGHGVSNFFFPVGAGFCLADRWHVI